MSIKIHSENSSLVSVIIPSYNHASYIEESVKSVWNQTYQNIELLVVDDGSSDTSVSIIRELEKNSPIPMRVVAKENEGLCRTLNKALEEVSGDYICVLASDDVMLPEKTEIQVGFMEVNTDITMCCGHYIVMTENDEISFENKIGEITFRELLSRNRIAAVTCMLRRADLLKLGGYDEQSYIEDWDLWLRISNKGKIYCINHTLAKYRQHESNASSNKKKMLEAKYYILNKWKESPFYREGLREVYVFHLSILKTQRNFVRIFQMLIEFPSLLMRKSIWKMLLRPRTALFRSFSLN